MLGPFFLNAADAETKMVLSAQQDWINQSRGMRFGLDKYEKQPIVTDPAEVQAKLDNTNNIYLKATPVANLTSAAKSAMPDAIRAAGSDPAVQKACVDLSNTRLYLMRLSTLFRTGASLGQVWLNALADIPGSDASGDPSKACDGILDAVAKYTPPIPDAKVITDAYVSNWVFNALQARLKVFEAA